MNIKQFIEYYRSQKAIHIKDNKDIVVMSFNIRCISDADKGNKYYKVRLPYIRKVLEEENPDIIGFQEAKVKQFKYLVKILKDYDYEYKKRDERKDGEATPIFYKKNRFTCLARDTFWLSDTYKEMSNTFNGSCCRICSYVCLKERNTNKELCVFNAHLDHKSDNARIKGVKLIKRLVGEFKYSDTPHLIIGDMNDHYGSAPINELFINYTDASKIKNDPNEVTFHNYGTDHQKIDYIALSKNIKQLDYKVITTKYGDIYPSDHYPIEVIINV
ncbi:MAG: endonuclease/exonuclease/phosphatase family protein [Bacilli bacterium]|nr:endonuclease/exonuclease/phosphatase family protein [Bacilli bacterium]